MPTCRRCSQAALSALLVVACLYALARHRGERLRRNKLNRHHHGSLPDEYGARVASSTRGPLNIEDDGISHAYAAKRSRSRSRSSSSVWESLVGEALDHPALDSALDPAALVPAPASGDSAAAAAAATHPPIRPPGEHHEGDRVDVRIPGGRPGPPLLYEAATVVAVAVSGLTVDVQYAVDGAVEKGVDVAVVRQRTGKGEDGGGDDTEEERGEEEGNKGNSGGATTGQATTGYVPGSDGTFAQNYQDRWVLAVARLNGWGTTRPPRRAPFPGVPTQGATEGATQGITKGVASSQRGEQRGFFLDFGAFDGTECSNTALLERELGWDGICVEPFPRVNGFAQRRCTLVQRGLAGVGGKVVEFDGQGQTRKMQVGGRGWRWVAVQQRV